MFARLIDRGAWLGACGLLATFALPVHAGDYPSKPIRILVPFVPGGATDILARLVGQNLTAAWGEQVVIDNRPGANGILAADMTAKATPDGHTLLFVAIGHAINPPLQKNLPYDTQKDFTPVSLAAILPLQIVRRRQRHSANAQRLHERAHRLAARGVLVDDEDNGVGTHGGHTAKSAASSAAGRLNRATAP